MTIEARCNGSRANGNVPTQMSDGSWGVFLPVFDPRCGKADYHVILSPQISKSSIVTWVGPLGCFPADTPKNKEVKEDLIKKHSPNAFYAVVDNEEGAHLAPLAITIDETENAPLYPCNGCPKFSK